MYVCLFFVSSKDSQSYYDVTSWHVVSDDRPAGCPEDLLPQNLVTYSSACLQINFNHTNWEVARNRCLSDGGDLVQIRTEGIQRFLEHFLMSQKMEKTGFWIGASDKDTESQWEWVAGERNMTYSNWQNGQGTKAPKHSQDSDLDDCAVMRVDYRFKWYDVPCTNKYLTYSYICQYALTSRSGEERYRGPGILMLLTTIVVLKFVQYMQLGR
ncbi:perlucin-like protein isoform X1 [Ostrea edulis]|uniref:perlucin-like protein isoform X1 n=1 Tax=Ostrea edulis TaxID=37623 RepID=UPI0020947FA7|nr:perlucin-like protein isoform X1 [Ostrea edulis]